MNDVIVIGGGPAGISAAAWLSDLERRFVWCSADAPGGTLDRVGNAIPNYPGRFADSGVALAAHLRGWLDDLGLAPTRCTVASITESSTGWSILTDAGDVHRGRAVLVATGTRARRLGLQGEDERAGDDVLFSVTRHRDRVAGERVVVVGGGDAALEGALLLSEVGCHVTLVHRGDHLSGQRRFERRVADDANIDVLLCEEVASLAIEQDRLVGVRLASTRVCTGSRLFVRIGVEPVVPQGVPAVVRDAAGYMVTDATGRTDAAGLYAAGDVCSPVHQSVAWSVGFAARAIAAALEDIDAKR